MMTMMMIIMMIMMMIVMTTMMMIMMKMTEIITSDRALLISGYRASMCNFHLIHMSLRRALVLTYPLATNIIACLNECSNVTSTNNDGVVKSVV